MTTITLKNEIGLDFIEGKETLNLLRKEGFPKDKILFAGIVNGKSSCKNKAKRLLYYKRRWNSRS